MPPSPPPPLPPPFYPSCCQVGIFASAESSQAADMVDVLCKEMQVRGQRAHAAAAAGVEYRAAALLCTPWLPACACPPALPIS